MGKRPLLAFSFACTWFIRSIPRIGPPFSLLFISRLVYFSGKTDASQKWFCQWSFTSKKFHHKIPTGSKVMAVSKGGTSGTCITQFCPLFPILTQIFLTISFLPPEVAVVGIKLIYHQNQKIPNFNSKIWTASSNDLDPSYWRKDYHF